MLLTKFQLIWPNGFREDFFFIGQSQTRTGYGSHISCMIGTNMEILHRISHTPFLQSNNSLCWSGKYKFSFHIIELKCHYCDETDVDVLNVFYHTKIMSDTETEFLYV